MSLGTVCVSWEVQKIVFFKLCQEFTESACSNYCIFTLTLILKLSKLAYKNIVFLLPPAFI
jgi:hypothetical protein